MYKKSLSVFFVSLMCLASAFDATSETVAQQPFQRIGNGVLNTIAVSPDGSRIATMSRAGIVLVWDAQNHEILNSIDTQTLKGVNYNEGHLAFSPDGQKLLTSGTQDTTVKIWDTSTGQLIRAIEFEGGFALENGVFNADGTQVVLGAKEAGEAGSIYTISVWDIAGGARLRTLENFNIKCFSNDGAWALTIYKELVDVSTGEIVWTIPAEQSILKAEFSGNSQRLLTAFGNLLEVWDLNTRQRLSGKDFQTTGSFGGITTMAISPDGFTVGIGYEDMGVKAGIVVANTLIEEQTVLTDGYVGNSDIGAIRSVVFSADGQQFLCASEDGKVYIFDTDSGERLGVLHEHSTQVTGLAVSPTTGEVAAAFVQTVKFYNIGQSELVRELASQSPIHDIAYSPDGSYLLLGNGDGAALYNSSDLSPVRTYAGQLGGAYDVTFSNDGERVLFATGGQLSCLYTIDGQLLAVLDGELESDNLVSFSSDGSRIITTARSSSRIILWDADTYEQIRTITVPQQVDSPATFSPDGLTILTGCGDGKAYLFDALTGSQLRELPDGSSGNQVIFSPDGNLVASSGGTIQIWDADTTELQLNLQGHYIAMWDMVFSPDGNYILSGSEDGTVNVWSIDGLYSHVTEWCSY